MKIHSWEFSTAAADGKSFVVEGVLEAELVSDDLRGRQLTEPALKLKVTGDVRVTKDMLQTLLGVLA